ncbi:MAG: hypothetical protein OXF28_01225 [Thaumarchaeota archaeon]|nr:hypothetical protein [Nitrososphaerota archaeon]MCY3975743.1 hypothetical protein [Nitrososphaerota archaeon]
MPELICQDCGKKMFHENEQTLKIEHAVHKKFCRKTPGKHYSYMHRDLINTSCMDEERRNDSEGKSVLKT